jgi:Domain of unknown function (DUF2760)
MNEWIVWGYPAQIDLGHLLLLSCDVVLTVAFMVVLIRLQKLRRESQAKRNESAEAVVSPLAVSGVASGAPANTVAPAPLQKPAETDTTAALQLLSIMQKEARVVDFFMQPVDGYSDADVASAARVIHSGGQKVFKEYIQVEPVRSEPEETTVTIAAGFNPQEVRLVGRVSGQAPFRGVLIHKGWRVKKMQLPQLLAGHDAHVLAPAEVEL